MRTGAVYPRQTNGYLPIFYSLQLERGTKQRLPLLQLKTQQLRLPVHRWKCSLQFYCLRVALQKRPLFQRQSTFWLPLDLCFYVQMASRQRCHLVHWLVLTTCCCKCPFFAWSVTCFLAMGILTLPGGREAHYGVLLVDISSLPSVLSLPVTLYSGRRALLDSFPDPSFSPALLAGRALQRACPLNFPRSWGAPDIPTSTWRSHLSLVVPRLFAIPCLQLSWL